MSWSHCEQCPERTSPTPLPALPEELLADEREVDAAHEVDAAREIGTYEVADEREAANRRREHFASAPGGATTRCRARRPSCGRPKRLFSSGFDSGDLEACPSFGSLR